MKVGDRMKRYKIEHILVDKKYHAVVVVAKDKTEAIALARQMDKDHFEESEEVVTHEWKAQSEWSLSTMLKSLFG